MRLVHKQPVNAKFLKRERVVLLFLGDESSCNLVSNFFLADSSCFTVRRLPLSSFMFRDRAFQLVELRLEKFAFGFFGHREFFQSRNG